MKANDIERRKSFSANSIKKKEQGKAVFSSAEGDAKSADAVEQLEVIDSLSGGAL